MDMELLKQNLIEYGKGLGFASLRITGSEAFTDWEDKKGLMARRDSHSSRLWDGMTYDPKHLMPKAQSIIIAAWPYRPYKDSFPKEIAQFSAYYREYPIGRKAIISLGKYLEKQGFEAIINPPLPAKAIALRAGLGYYRKNGLIYIDGIGSFVSLHYILTDAKLLPDSPMGKVPSCGSCSICIKACPTGAIGKEGGVRPSKCIRHHMLSSDFIPLKMRESMGTKLLGCDICQLVCPFNSEIKGQDNPLPKENLETFCISNILDEWPSGLKNRMRAMGEIIGDNYARAQKVLSTTAILAGNSRERAYTKALIELLKHPHPPIRGHSAWALGEIRDYNGIEALNAALRTEKDCRVIDEIRRTIKLLT